jgi:hypothetical protein
LIFGSRGLVFLFILARLLGLNFVKFPLLERSAPKIGSPLLLYHILIASHTQRDSQKSLMKGFYGSNFYLRRGW